MPTVVCASPETPRVLCGGPDTDAVVAALPVSNATAAAGEDTWTMSTSTDALSVDANSGATRSLRAMALASCHHLNRLVRRSAASDVDLQLYVR